MNNLLENIMLGLFVMTMFIWLLQAWNIEKTFNIREKVRAISFAAAFLVGIFSMATGKNEIGVVICSAGFVISEFAVAVVFYENYKNLEVPYE